MILNSKFDVLRGWPQKGAIDDTFPVAVVAGNPVVLPLGTIVTLTGSGYGGSAVLLLREHLADLLHDLGRGLHCLADRHHSSRYHCDHLS